jgi:hypothetical protein
MGKKTKGKKKVVRIIIWDDGEMEFDSGPDTGIKGSVCEDLAEGVTEAVSSTGKVKSKRTKNYHEDPLDELKEQLTDG